MPRRRQRPKHPGASMESVWAEREAKWNVTRGERRKRILQQLREGFKEGERSLAGWPAITAWFNALGFRNREGGLVTEWAAKGWQKRLGCPVWRGRPGVRGRWRGSVAWTTNYLLLAWAASLYRSGGPEMPRIVLDSSPQPSVSRSAARPAYASEQPVRAPARFWHRDPALGPYRDRSSQRPLLVP